VSVDTEPYLTAELADYLAAPAPEREHVHVHVTVSTVIGLRVRCSCGDDITEPWSLTIPPERRCWRCGVDWIDKRSKFIAAAPCRDCRDALVEDNLATRNDFLRPQHRTNRAA
jgi:hypothetical protein